LAGFLPLVVADELAGLEFPVFVELDAVGAARGFDESVPNAPAGYAIDGFVIAGKNGTQLPAGIEGCSVSLGFGQTAARDAVSSDQPRMRHVEITGSAIGPELDYGSARHMHISK